MPEAPAPTPVLSSTSTSRPLAARCHAVARPWIPAPTTTTPASRSSGITSTSSVARRLPAGQRGRLPVLPDGGGALEPRAGLWLRELGVDALELDAVGVAGQQVRHQHLAGDLVLAALGDREVDLDE